VVVVSVVEAVVVAVEALVEISKEPAEHLTRFDKMNVF